MLPSTNQCICAVESSRHSALLQFNLFRSWVSVEDRGRGILWESLRHLRSQSSWYFPSGCWIYVGLSYASFQNSHTELKYQYFHNDVKMTENIIEKQLTEAGTMPICVHMFMCDRDKTLWPGMQNLRMHREMCWISATRCCPTSTHSCSKPTARVALWFGPCCTSKRGSSLSAGDTVQ